MASNARIDGPSTVAEAPDAPREPAPNLRPAQPAPSASEYARAWMPTFVDHARWLPLGLALAVAVLFFVFHAAFDINHTDVRLWAADPRTALFEWQAHAIAARVQWSTAVFVATIIMLGLAGASLWTVFTVRRPNGRSLAVLLIGIGAVCVAFHLESSAFLPPFHVFEMMLVSGASDFDPGPRLTSFLAGLFSTAVLIAVAVGAHLEKARQATDVAEIVESWRFVRVMMTATTTWLIVGVIGIGAFHRMICAHAIPAAVPALEVLGTSSTIFAGAFYSALVAVTFGPVEVVLRARAKQEAQVAQSAKSPDAWLDDQGVDLSVLRELARVLTVFGPLLASILQGLAELAT